MILVPRRERGQAMTEMVVAFSFVVVPLFLLIPVLGKYIDMKHATVSGARYVSWEQTVTWDGLESNNSEAPPGFRELSVNLMPRKSDLQLKGEIEQRIFAEAATCLLPYGASDNKVRVRGEASCQDAASESGRHFWTYHDGNSMIEVTRNGFANNLSPGPDLTSDSSFRLNTQVVDTVYSVVNGFGSVLQSVTSVLGIFSNGGRSFDVIRDVGEFSSARVELPVAPLPEYTHLRGERDSLLTIAQAPLMSARGAIVSQGWAAGGPEHLKNRSKSLVPTSIIGDIFGRINIPVLGSGQDILATLLLSPELGDSSLKFGEMNTDILPRDKYDNPEAPAHDDASRPLCNEAGYCRD